MKQDGIRFHHPIAFWTGCMLVLLGVLAHGPMFWMGRFTQWQMVGMPMTTDMWIGMALIPVGLALSGWGLLPRRAVPRTLMSGNDAARFQPLVDPQHLAPRRQPRRLPFQQSPADHAIAS